MRDIQPVVIVPWWWALLMRYPKQCLVLAGTVVLALWLFGIVAHEMVHSSMPPAEVARVGATMTAIARWTPTPTP
jgi:hypothetical protein